LLVGRRGTSCRAAACWSGADEQVNGGGHAGPTVAGGLAPTSRSTAADAHAFRGGGRGGHRPAAGGSWPAVVYLGLAGRQKENKCFFFRINGGTNVVLFRIIFRDI
jgi:hypothetical protein